MSTIFKKIIDKTIPAQILHEDDLCLVFQDIQPQAPHHWLCIPKEEIPNLCKTLPRHKELLGHMLLTLNDLAKKKGIDQSGYRIAINTNKDGGQIVYHLHMHLLAGRSLSWPPG